jgi:hypothetical protein
VPGRREFFMPTLVRLYAVPLKGIALLEVGGGLVRTGRALMEDDPLLCAILGPLTEERLAVLGSALRSGHYALTWDDNTAAFSGVHVLAL